MPARSPEQRLQRVLRVARVDAVSLLVVAAPAAAVSVCAREWGEAAAGAGIALCGVLEWAGRNLLQRRRAAGLGWMATAQLGCLLFILFLAWDLAHREQADRIVALLPSFTREQLDVLFPDAESLRALLVGVQRLTAALLALVSILYQGGLALYYLRTRPAALAVFAEPPVLGPLPPPAP